MKLLNEIIASLSSESYSLGETLLKTKVLLHQLGRKELAEWVNQELTGYSLGEDTVPKYRRIRALVKGHVSNGYYTYSNYQLPTMHLKEAVRRRWENLSICESISAIEKLVKNGEEAGHLSVAIPPEANHMFDEVITDGYHVQKAWSEIGKTQFTQILIEVRSRLLDFLLELRGRVGTDATEEEVKKLGQLPETASMFNNAIFGDNVTILVGSGNTQTIKNQIIKGDFEALAHLLRQNKVDESDVEALKAALGKDAEAPELADKKYGPAIREWITGMMSKAVDTSWAIELSVAGNLLTDALKHYYGWLS